MRGPYALPSAIMAEVESAFSTIFCVVPAVSRVEPASTSPPVSISTARSAARAISPPGALVTATARAPASRAARSAPSTYGVRPEALMPTTASAGVEPGRQQVGGAGRLVVLGALHRGVKRRPAARDHGDDHVRVGAEGGHALGGVEHREAPRCPRAGVAQPAPGAHPRGDRLGGARQRRERPPQRVVRRDPRRRRAAATTSVGERASRSSSPGRTASVGSESSGCPASAGCARATWAS